MGWPRRRAVVSGEVPGGEEGGQEQPCRPGSQSGRHLGPEEADGAGSREERSPAQQFRIAPGPATAFRRFRGADVPTFPYRFCPVAPHSLYRLALSDSTSQVYVSRAPLPAKRAAASRGRPRLDANIWPTDEPPWQPAGGTCPKADLRPPCAPCITRHTLGTQQNPRDWNDPR